MNLNEVVRKSTTTMNLGQVQIDAQKWFFGR